MSLVCAMGLFSGILGWNAITPKLIGNPEWWIWFQLLFGKLLRWVDSDSRLEYGSRSGCLNDQSLRVSNGTSKSVSFAETIQTEVYPFLEASPISETPIPSEISKEFSSVFSESQADILPVPPQF
ncbi:hypothetical protein BASA81_016370 [Batrachochytrium salamandrivorans]|nr:hypothetical protein BASA81_016370 [Batrachochytrium salamandrivorans]